MGRDSARVAWGAIRRPCCLGGAGYAFTPASGPLMPASRPCRMQGAWNAGLSACPRLAMTISDPESSAASVTGSDASPRIGASRRSPRLDPAFAGHRKAHAQHAPSSPESTPTSAATPQRRSARSNRDGRGARRQRHDRLPFGIPARHRVRSSRRLMAADDVFPHPPVDAPKARSRASSTRFGDALARDDQFAVGPRPMRRPCGDVRISGAPKKPMGLSCAVARFLGGEAARRGCPLQAGSDGSVDHAFFDLRCLMNARHCLSRVIHSLPG
jgi:hypothetical protein